MRKTDARQLDHQTLEDMRIRAVKSVQNGKSPEDVAVMFDVHRTAVYKWLALYRDSGWSALKSKPTPGAKPKIDGKKMEWVFDTVTQKNPQQLKFEFALWTREMIQKLIKDKFEIKLSLKAVGRLLGQLGLTCQKPLYKAIQKKNPQQLKFEFALWTREMIQKLIKDKFEIKLSLKAVGRLLGQLGLTCQKPLYKAIQKDKVRKRASPQGNIHKKTSC